MYNTVFDYASPFAAWELRLFLDTHPHDQRALAAYQQLCSQGCAAGGYACLPDSEYNSARWHWIDEPWPWEPEANCGACRAAPVQRPVARYGRAR